MAHLHTDMERVDIHVALEVCEIVIESATLVSIVFALSGSPIYVAQFPLASMTRLHPVFSSFGLPVHVIASQHFDSFAFCSKPSGKHIRFNHEGHEDSLLGLRDLFGERSARLHFQRVEDNAFHL